MSDSPGEAPIRALVTGASRGIGAAVARRLAALGHPVVINYRRDADGAASVRDQIEAQGGEATLTCFDVADADAAETGLREALEDPRPIGILVNNAGITRDGLFPAMKREAWESVTRTAIDGFYNVTRPLVMPMVKRRAGRIITIVSVSGLVGNPGQVNYSAGKAGLIGATRSLAAELASRKITVNAIAPGIIDTAMAANVPEAMIERIPMKRAGTPEEVADLVGFLAGESAGYITGQVIGINGGLV